MNIDPINVTELCLLGRKYAADKSPLVYHNYTPFYFALWNDRRNDIKRVFELGINAGASLRMWEEFFPNAEIIGADFKPSLLFNEGRIKSYFADQRSAESLEELVQHLGKDFDIMIDDGSHEPADQLLTAQILSPLLAKDGIYVIEDVADGGGQEILKAFPGSEYFPFQPNHSLDNLILIYADDKAKGVMVT